MRCPHCEKDHPGKLRRTCLACWLRGKEDGEALGGCDELDVIPPHFDGRYEYDTGLPQREAPLSY